MREFLLGNEAIARGAWEAGVKFVAGYPGTPSTEIIETLATRFPETNPRWSANEKVAFEEGMGGHRRTTRPGHDEARRPERRGGRVHGLSILRHKRRLRGHLG